MDRLYTFETDQFGINDEGIHLLRSKYNYKSIVTGEIEFIELIRGKEFVNWVFILLIGIVMLVFGLYYGLSLFDFFNSSNGGRIYIEELLVPFFPICIGIYMVYVSFRTTMILKVQLKNKKFQLSMRPLIKEGKYEEFEKYMNENIKNKQGK